MHENYFALSLEAMRRATAKGIELLPTPNSLNEEFMPGVMTTTPRGHYLDLSGPSAQIVAVRDYRPISGTYADLIPGFAVCEICNLEVVGDRALDREFVSINYRRITA